MKLIIAKNNGEVVEIIENLEDYDLSKSVAAADLLDDIKLAIDRGRKDEE